MMGVILFLLFTLIPAVETWLIVRIGSVIGATETVAYLVAAGLLGAWLGKRAGVSVLRQIMAELQQGIPPADRLVEGALVLVASVLLLTPGYLTDLMGMLLFIGPIRRFLAPRIKSLALRWLMERGMKVGAAGPGPGAPPHPVPGDADRPVRGGPFRHPVA